MKKDSKQLGTRREVKNVNSFRNVEKAINYEFEYQTKILDDGGKIQQETLLWDDSQMVTKSIRSKEDAKDYRYFPEPDLPPLVIEDDLIDEVRSGIPELPDVSRARLMESYSLDKEQVNYLIQNKAIFNYFESMCDQEAKSPIKYYNWITIDVLKYLKDNNINIKDFPIRATALKELIDMEIEEKIDHSKAKKVFQVMLETGKKCPEVINELGYDKKENLDDLDSFINSNLKKYPSELERLKSGEVKLINFFVGIIMRESKGKYPPSLIMNFLNKKFNN